MRQRRNIPPKAIPQYAIVVDGETEFWYIQMLTRNEKLANVHLKPEILQKKKLSEQYLKVIELANDYDKVYWVVDSDVIHKETREAPKGKKTALQEFKEYCSTIKEKHDNIIIVVVNHPCFEYWLLLHFEATSKCYDSYSELITQLKKHIPDYSKSRAYYIKKDNDIYSRLKDKLPGAIANAKKLKETDISNYSVGICQMHLLFQDLGLQ